MAAPLKPWERPGINYQQSTTLPSNPMASMPMDQDRLSAIDGVASPVPSVSSSPQVPPRPTQQSYQNRFNSGLGLGGMGGYNSYSSPYSSFGGYGGGMCNSPYSSYGGGYGYNNRFNDLNGSSFARHAEESSRPAFESIESIVNAVTSVGMMLDSTFQAVYSSFRAVIGVADNFSRLKSQLVQVFSALAFIRTLRYLFRRLLELIRLKPPGEAEREWKKALQQATAAAADSSDGSPKKSMWPILMFFGIIMGGPYLIWKLISKFSGNQDEKDWASGKEDHFVAQALYSFQGQGVEEVSFSKGQHIKIAPKELQPRVRGWLLASVDGKKTGMVPANYLKVLGKKKGTSHSGQEQQLQAAGAESGSKSEFMNDQTSRSRTNNDNFEDAFSTNRITSGREDDLDNVLDNENQEAADILSEVDES